VFTTVTATPFRPDRMIRLFAKLAASGLPPVTLTIGYPPFIGIFTAGGSRSSPLAQAQERQGQNGFGDGFGDGFGGFGGFGGFNGFGAPRPPRPATPATPT